MSHCKYLFLKYYYDTKSISDFSILEKIKNFSQEFFSGKTNGPGDFGIWCFGFQLKHFERIFFKAGS